MLAAISCCSAQKESNRQLLQICLPSGASEEREEHVFFDARQTLLGLASSKHKAHVCSKHIHGPSRWAALARQKPGVCPRWRPLPRTFFPSATPRGPICCAPSAAPRGLLASRTPQTPLWASQRWPAQTGTRSRRARWLPHPPDPPASAGCHFHCKLNAACAPLLVAPSGRALLQKYTNLYEPFNLIHRAPCEQYALFAVNTCSTR
jgi:hypothetical protein